MFWNASCILVLAIPTSCRSKSTSHLTFFVRKVLGTMLALNNHNGLLELQQTVAKFAEKLTAHISRRINMIIVSLEYYTKMYIC